jgi:carboxypeptidase PM20D1
MWRWIGAALLAVVVALGGVVAFRTATFASPAPALTSAAPDVAAYQLDGDKIAAHLSQAIRFRTVSLAGTPADDPTQFAALHAWLAETYPAFYAAAKLENVGAGSLLFTWQGSDPSLPPLLLLAHQDVVPVPDDTRKDWKADPFGGEIRDGVIWGRGALDDKDSLIGIFEAADMFARAGRTPKRTIIFASGHDEELGGEQGAIVMADVLKQRGVKAWFAIDEGMVAVREHPLTGGPAALIGVAEKGSGTLSVVASAEPGHSSMPARETAVSTLARAVTAIHDMPIDRRIAGGPAEDMMRALADHMKPTQRMALANEWLFGPLINAQLADNAAAQALLGTTVAPTVINGGLRENVLPGEARALINLRIHPRDTPDSLLARARAAVKGIDGVSVDWLAPPRPASPVSRADTDSYALIAAISRALLPDAPVSPGLVLGGTDGRSYADVAENVYRYQGVLLGAGDWETIHGLNEHISTENLERLTRFYAGLIDQGAMQ